MINNFEHIINMCSKRYQWFNLCVNPVKGDCVCDIVENLIMQNYIAKYNIRRFTLLYPHWDVRDFFMQVQHIGQCVALPRLRGQFDSDYLLKNYRSVFQWQNPGLQNQRCGFDSCQACYQVLYKFNDFLKVLHIQGKQE